MAPMTGGLDKYLVEQNRAGSVFAAVSDPDQADAFFSEGPGSSFYADPARGAHQVRFCFCKKRSTLEEAGRRLRAWAR